MEQFVVSALKYRPATFRSVVGQAHVTETLRNAVARGQLAHAYLFTGPRGVGKTTCARIFAKAINCLDPTPEHEACGVCESCRAFAEGRSFSIHELDAASNNSVDDIRTLTEKVRIPPQVGRYSVYIIDEVHMLSANAFNAFLKTLEEPPAYAVFILATTEKHKILPTILSRCQCYDFNRIRVEDMVDYLGEIAAKEGVEADDESLHIIAQRADGGLRDALSMFDRVVSFCGNRLAYDKVAESLNVLDYNTYFEAVDLVLAENYPQLLTLFDTILKKGFEGQLFITGLNSHLRDLLVCKNPQTAPLLEVTGALAKRYQAQAALCDVAMLLEGIGLLTQTDTSYRQATNRRLHAELALIKLCGLKKKDSPDGEIAVLWADPGAVPLPEIKIAPQTPAGSTPAATTETTATAPVVPTAVSATVETGASSDTEAVNPEPAGPPPSSNPVAPAATPAAEQPKTAPAVSEPPASRSPRPAAERPRSVSGISISNPLPASSPQPTVQESVSTPLTEASEQEAEERITTRFPQLIERWERRGRPRIVTVLTTARIEGGRITLPVQNEVLADELGQAKWEIEKDLRELTLLARITLEIEVDTRPAAYKPVSIEDKLQYLVERNPLIVKLRDELDLTI